MKKLQRFSAPTNDLGGNLPEELGKMKRLKHFNITSNRITGTVPDALCHTKEGNNLIDIFGCDAILCPPGTFHPNGASNDLTACSPCPKSKHDDLVDPPISAILGRATCFTAASTPKQYSDGRMSTREVLKKLYDNLVGENWGEKFAPWANIKTKTCDLPGIICLGREIGRIDLAEAHLCADDTGGSPDCKGLPTELGYLSSLEVLTIPGSQFLVSTLPTEIGLLRKLQYLEVAHCPSLYGKIPSEYGRLSLLKIVNFADNRLVGSIPTQLFALTHLEKLHLSANSGITGTIPTEIGELSNLKELMLSRLSLEGSIPTSVGRLSSVENVELYGNSMNGTLPTELGGCTNLKRLGKTG